MPGCRKYGGGCLCARVDRPRGRSITEGRQWYIRDDVLWRLDANRHKYDDGPFDV